MNQLADTIWREFAVEAEEHLHLIEQVLVHSTHAVSAAQVAQLFRSFHSLKGLGRTLGLTGIESTAHLAENILGVVREGAAVLDDGLAACLLQGVDALKELVHHATASRGDAPAPEAVLARLRQVGERLTGGTSTPAAPVADAAPALSEDDEMLVFFAEALADNVPALARALGDADGREAARDAAEMIAHGADMLGFELLRDNAQAIATLVAEDAPDQARLRQLLEEVTAQAAIIAELTATDVGVNALNTSLAEGAAPAPREPLVQALERVAEDAEPMALAARDAYQWAGAAGRPRVADLLLHAVDLCQRMVRGEITLTEPLLAWLRAVVAETGAAADLTPEAAQGLTAELRRCLGVETIPEEHGAFGQWVAGIVMPPELMELLSVDQLVEIADAVGSGRERLYTVRAFLEQHPEGAKRFVRWLQTSCRAVTNRTVLDGTGSGFEFLLLSELGPEDFKRQVLDLDPAGSCVRLASALGGEGEVPLVSPETRAAEQAAPKAAEAASHSVIRVRSESIDALVRQIGETLVIANGIGGELDALREALAGTALAEGMNALTELHQRLDRAIGLLHEQTIELRVVPLDTLFTRLLRAARELAQEQDKAVSCQAEGRDVRIDKTIVEQLAAPLTHMVRNAIDHGIEAPGERAATAKPPVARFTISAAQRGNEVTITLADDGRGLNEQRILATAVKRGLITGSEGEFLPAAEIRRLIFLPGFSTAETISETSGRGVGMDVVLTTVTALGGRIDIDSEPGHGTTFTIHLPLSAALQSALLIGVGGQIMAVPERHLAEVRKVERADIRTVRGQPCLPLRGSMLPLFPMAELLGLPVAPVEDGPISVLVIASGPARVGVMVDQLHRRQELYMKDLHPRLASIPGVGGASVLGDGQVVLVLEGEGLIRRARQQAAAMVDAGGAV